MGALPQQTSNTSLCAGTLSDVPDLHSSQVPIARTGQDRTDQTRSSKALQAVAVEQDSSMPANTTPAQNPFLTHLLWYKLVDACPTSVCIVAPGLVRPGHMMLAPDSTNLMAPLSVRSRGIISAYARLCGHRQKYGVAGTAVEDRGDDGVKLPDTCAAQLVGWCLGQIGWLHHDHHHKHNLQEGCSKHASHTCPVMLPARHHHQHQHQL